MGDEGQTWGQSVGSQQHESRILLEPSEGNAQISSPAQVRSESNPPCVGGRQRGAFWKGPEPPEGLQGPVHQPMRVRGAKQLRRGVRPIGLAGGHARGPSSRPWALRRYLLAKTREEVTPMKPKKGAEGVQISDMLLF